MQRNRFAQYFMAKYLEESPTFDDLNEDRKTDFFFEISDFVELVSNHASKSCNYYNFLIEKRYTSIDMTIFEDVVLKFLQSECTSDQSLIDNARKAFSDYLQMFPPSLIKFRNDLLSIYFGNGSQEDFAKSEFLNLLSTVPETRIVPDDLRRELVESKHLPFDARLESFFKIIQLPESAKNASMNFVQTLQHILDESCLAPLKPKVHIFGSIISGLENFSADIDLLISFEQTRNALYKLDYTTSTFLLNFLAQILFGRNFVQEFANRAHVLELRRAPIIKIEPRRWNKNVGIDISATSKYALHNSRMLKSLALYDSRFPKLIRLLKFWAKRVKLVRYDAISSYGFTLLVLFFCQQQKILPPVQTLTKIVCQKYNIDSTADDFTVFSYTDEKMFEITVEEIESQFDRANQLSVEHLASIFFEFYSNFPYSTCVICPRTGHFEDRERIIKLRAADKVSYEHFDPGEVILEDPLQVQHNVAGSRLQAKKLSEFFQGIVKKIKLSSKPILDVLLLEKLPKFN